jgi:uncharacterized membrane protein YfcA
MIYIISFFAGFLNGLFASGAGQILVFYYIYILKIKTHEARTLSMALISISSIFSVIGYSKFIKFDFLKIAILISISIVFGVIGNKIMKKISAIYLNLISGLLIVGLILYKIIKGG